MSIVVIAAMAPQVFAQAEGMTHRLELISKTIDRGILTTRVSSINGSITIYLPEQIQSGDRISGSILLTPNGNSENLRAHNLALLSKMDISVLGLKLQPTKFAFTVTAPKSDSQVVIGDNEINVTIRPTNTFTVQRSSSFAILKCSGTSPLIIPGAYDGDSLNTKCLIAGYSAIILVESPRLLAVSVPSWLTGAQRVQVEEQRQPAIIGD